MSYHTVISFITGTRQGYLTKRKKDADEWKNRWFVLTRDYLSYYINYQVQLLLLLLLLFYSSQLFTVRERNSCTTHLHKSLKSIVSAFCLSFSG